MSEVFRLAVPFENSEGLEPLVAVHFGHCDYFTMIELTEEGIGAVEAVPNVPHAQGSCQAPTDLLGSQAGGGKG